jgi:hypothetical protein
MAPNYGAIRGKGGNSGGGRRRKRVQGETTLRSVLRNLPDALGEAIKKEIREAAELVHFEALKRIPNEHQNPYSTGDLSSKFKVVIDKGGFRARIGSFGRNRARHAHLVEFGTAAGTRKDRFGNTYQHPGSRAHPYLVPAYQLHRVENFRRIKAAVVRALEAASRGDGVLSGSAPMNPTQSDLGSLIGDSLE